MTAPTARRARSRRPPAVPRRGGEGRGRAQPDARGAGRAARAHHDRDRACRRATSPRPAPRRPPRPAWTPRASSRPRARRSGPGCWTPPPGSDVLVCGSRGQGGLARAMLGSTSTSLLHHATLPLLIVPDVAPADGPAVLTYDGSDVAGNAIGVVGPLLGGRPAVVVHVWESPYRHSLTGRALSRVSELEDIVEGLEASTRRRGGRGHRVAASASPASPAWTCAARPSTPASGVWRAVVPFAAALDAAVIVTGARGARRRALRAAGLGLLGARAQRRAPGADRAVVASPGPGEAPSSPRDLASRR